MIIKESKQLQSMVLRTTNKIVELEYERKTLQMQTQCEHKKIGLLAGLLAKEKKLLEDKKELLYQVDFKLQKCEMKIERIRGFERDKSEIEKKQKRIEELQVVLNEKTTASKLFQNQIATLEVIITFLTFFPNFKFTKKI